MEDRPASITGFFPCYNDEATIGSLIVLADQVLQTLTDDYEVLVIDDGSQDGSLEVLEALTADYPSLKIVKHAKNRGYGGALRSGFTNATKDLVFYTDGDAQYDVKELKDLYQKWLETDVDFVNGYKLKRNDPWCRIVIGKIYQHLMKIIFCLKVKDVDCDFRLIRRSVFEKVELTQDTGVICVEMMHKFGAANLSFAEVPVHHFFRRYGKSQFFQFPRLLRVARALVKLWWTLMVIKKLKGMSRNV
jgi:glycosyltransferase involved in cell wall biosynthesis